MALLDEFEKVPLDKCYNIFSGTCHTYGVAKSFL